MKRDDQPNDLRWGGVLNGILYPIYTGEGESHTHLRCHTVAVGLGIDHHQPVRAGYSRGSGLIPGSRLSKKLLLVEDINVKSIEYASRAARTLS